MPALFPISILLLHSCIFFHKISGATGPQEFLLPPKSNEQTIDLLLDLFLKAHGYALVPKEPCPPLMLSSLYSFGSPSTHLAWLILRGAGTLFAIVLRLFVDFEAGSLGGSGVPRLASLTGQQALETLLSRLVISGLGSQVHTVSPAFLMGSEHKRKLAPQAFHLPSDCFKLSFLLPKEELSGCGLCVVNIGTLPGTCQKCIHMGLAPYRLSLKFWRPSPAIHALLASLLGGPKRQQSLKPTDHQQTLTGLSPATLLGPKSRWIIFNALEAAVCCLSDPTSTNDLSGSTDSGFMSR